jgi:hypothetical protein
MNQPLTGSFKLNQYALFSHLKRGTKIICVYAVLNTATQRAYVGSTADFFGRWGKHLCELKGGYHGSLELQADYTKDPDAFEIRLIEVADTTDGLMELEQAIGERFNVEQLYNCRIGQRYIKGRYGLNASAPRPKTKGVRRQLKSRWYDGQNWRASACYSNMVAA